MNVSSSYGEKTDIAKELLTEIDGAYERKCMSSEAFTTVGVG